MFRSKINLLIICFTTCVLLVFLLFLFSNQQRNNPHGFIRQLPSHKIVGIAVKDLKYNSWYLSGNYGMRIYCGNQVSPGRMLEIDSNLRDINEVAIEALEGIELYKGATVIFDAKNTYLFDGVKPVILVSNRTHSALTKQIKTPYFTSAVPLSQNSFALRYVNIKNENVLVKLTVGTDSLKSTSLLEKQVDGVFCTDGEIVKIPGYSKMIYVYYYRNQFLCADSNLNLLYKGKTIDTISHAQIKVAKIKSSGQITMAAPPLYVNKRACANEKYLFVQSALRANNETDYMIKNVSMIDVYAVKDGKYQFSFYLPDFRGNKIRDFKVYGQSLYALYDHYLYKYQLNF